MNDTIKPITPRQGEALKFIETFIETKGYSPTVRELAAGLGLRSSSTASTLIDQLIAKGYITKEEDGPRTIRIIRSDGETTTDTSAQFSRMKAALRNILDISSDEFAKHQARYGLGIKE